MKKIILILMSLISLSLAADGWGVDVGTKISSVKDKNVLGIQSVKELAGDGGTEVYIESFYKHQFAQVGLRYTNLNEVNDNKIDLTWKLHLNDKSESDIKFFLNGGFGFGMQGSRTSTISTNITKTEYITSSNIDAYKFIVDSGFFNEMYDENNRKIYKPGNSKIMIVQRGEDRITGDNLLSFVNLLNKTKEHCAVFFPVL